MNLAAESFATHLECSRTGEKFPLNELHNLSPAGVPLLVKYNLDRAREFFPKEKILTGDRSLWRYAPMLPVENPENRICLGEGWTPLLKLPRWNASNGFENLYIKDEAANPSLSFKARGLTMAVSRAHELGVKKIALPSAGNAASATATYCAAVGIECHVFMPNDAPKIIISECETLGAYVYLIDGLITDCGREVAQRKEKEGWFDVSTLKEPYRLEGKKTLGYELAEQFDWDLPEVILYPTGGGTGLIGMWKAFDEMEKMGWIGSKRPRMVSVQAAGCAPIIRAFEQGAEKADPWENAETMAAGLRVPVAVGDFLILRGVRESGGTAVAVEEEVLLKEVADFGRGAGIILCPEGGAVIAAAKQLLAQGWIEPDERVVAFNTGSGVKYQEALERAKSI